ncbi:hypothetical protein glysoja_046635 [Glycine soja]|uniref:Uncharacterized protein n=1 Tax=Glycine soja TaxID=3848 RepID=A0A0B2QP63_GLYSO|nr:hypothetical protein glysoja_046635 [Glycine soja]
MPSLIYIPSSSEQGWYFLPWLLVSQFPFLTLILPCACFLRILRGKVTRTQAALCITIIIVGVVCSTFGSYSALAEIVKSLRG